MGRDSGRTNTPGNQKGAARPINISMKDPSAHKKVNKGKK